MIVTKGATNVSVYYYIRQDASATSPGEPVTGLLFSDIETGGSASYVRQGAARVDLTLITLASASATHADGGFILVDDTNMPGLYRCDYPDATFVTGVDVVTLQIVVASANNAVADPIFVQLTGVDLQDTTTLGLTNLDATISSRLASANINLASGVVESNLLQMGGVVQSAADLKDFADAGYDPSANKVQGVVLVDTTTTNTDMRGTDSGALASVCTEGRLAELDAANLPAVTDAIKVPTDKMVFTVANQLDVNVQYWDDVEVTTSLETSADVADAVWDEAQADHVAAGSFGIMASEIAAIPTTAMRGTDSAALASVCTEPRLAELDAANLPTDISNLNDVSIADILASQLTESYAADGVAPTLSQAIFLIQQLLGDFSIAGTTLTVREIDGATTAATFTLDSATAPTDITRAT